MRKFIHTCLKSSEIPGKSKTLARPPRSKSNSGVLRKLIVIEPTNGTSTRRGLKWTRILAADSVRFDREAFTANKVICIRITPSDQCYISKMNTIFVPMKVTPFLTIQLWD